MPIRKSDYENYDYREFWEDDKRYYEDQSERIALRSMLKGVDPSNNLFIDIGCGYGRLFNEYSKFQRVVLIDYSMKNLRNARDRISRFLSDDPGKLSDILFISADAAALPIRNDSVDTILTVRVMHHLERPEKYFDEVKRVLKSGSLYLLEFANKRNLKNILRFFTGKMDTSPFNLVPSQVGETIKNYHPKDIYKKLTARDIRIKKIISVSNFRLGILKKIFGSRLLIFFETIYQKIFSFITWGPSIFIKGYSVKAVPSSNQYLTEANLREDGRQTLPDSGEQTLPDTGKKASRGSGIEALPDSGMMDNGGGKRFSEDLSRESFLNFADILACPACHVRDLTLSGDKVKCGGCRKVFSVDGNIIDLKV